VTALWAFAFVLPLSSLAMPADAASKQQIKKSSKVKSASKKQSKKVTKKVARSAAKCDSNYSGCVPVASDVDCKPGSGNGPAYLSVAVKVLKSDIYRLDADHDGLACEK